ncbi:MAG: hypothetical protein H0W83_15365, partial [Planctomycetes bacterium]|nr:hypothetical protein [Planctomycetota bacterium]
MNVLILGCGTIGGMVAAILGARGHRCVGVRRTAAPPVEGVSTMVGDLADPALYRRLDTSFDAVLISANPGFRRGRDNGLAAGALLVGAQLPRARLVYSGTTAVYADAGGADVDESGALADDPAVAGLLAIERAVCAH